MKYIYITGYHYIKRPSAWFVYAALLMIFNICSGNDQIRNYKNPEIRGLRFLSKENPTGSRTSLYLFPEAVKVNSVLHLEFDFRIYNHLQYGHIFNIFYTSSNNSEPLYSLIHFPDQEPGKKRLSLSLYDIELSKELPLTIHNGDWMHFSIRIELQTKKIVFSLNDSVYDFAIKKQAIEKVNIFFGEQKENEMEVAAFELRDIKLNIDGEKIYFWPLYHTNNSFVKDTINDQIASLTNPDWLINYHYYWEKEYSGTFDEMCGITFNYDKGEVLLVNQDSLCALNIKTNEVTITRYKNKRPVSQEENFSLYDNKRGALISYNFNFYKNNGEKAFTRYNYITGKWSAINYNYHREDNFNPVLAWDKNSNLVKFGGYAYYTYYNDFSIFNFDSLKWYQINFTGDTIYPRTYSCGAFIPGTNMMYIFGGKGNKLGQQVLGVENYYDLFKIDFDSKTINKLWELKIDGFEFLPASDMIIDTTRNCFYTEGINEKRNHHLYRFSLTNGDYKISSDTIRSSTGGLKSDSYLFYDKLTTSLVAVFRKSDSEEKKSFVSVFRINYPPASSEDIISDIAVKPDNKRYWIVVCSIIIVLGFFIIILKRYRFGNRNIHISISEIKRPQVNAIWFLGGLKVFDKLGNDITYMFSNKLKQTFSLIYLSQFFKDGITNEEFTAILWPGMDKPKIRNNKGVTLNNLKNILGNLESVSIERIENKFTANVSGTVYVDIYELYQKFNQDQKLKSEELIQLFEFGNLLGEESYQGIDKFKEIFESTAIKELITICADFYKRKKFLSVIETSNLIHSLYDPLSEEAIRYKLVSLNKLNQYQKIVKEYKHFCNEYYDRMNTEFLKTVDELLKI